MAAFVPSVADPSAMLVASLFALAARMTRPPATIRSTSVVMTVCTRTVEIVIAMPAATEMRPSEVDALGELAVSVPTPLPPFFVDDVFMYLRCVLTCLSTPFLPSASAVSSSSDSSASGTPLADALAIDPATDRLSARSATSSPASTSRASVAVAP